MIRYGEMKVVWSELTVFTALAHEKGLLQILGKL